MTENIPINANICQFLSSLYSQDHYVRSLYQQSRREFVRTDNATKQYGVVRELIKRRRKFGDAAKMNKLEEAALMQYGQFLVGMFHDLNRTPVDQRPVVSLTPGGGVAWMPQEPPKELTQ